MENTKEMIRVAVEARMPEATVELKDIQKNNGVVLTGLIIKEASSNIAPTIYIDRDVKALEMGDTNLDTVVDEILNVYNQNKVNWDFDVTMVTDFEKAKDKIVCCLVNKEQNQELLQSVSHIDYLDLAVIFKLVIPPVNEGMATITVRDEFLERWDVSVEELYELAKANSRIILPGQAKNMFDVLAKMVPAEVLDGMIPEAEAPMYVISNNKNVNGASTILYSEVLANLADKIEDDLFVLPSSIHEVIAVPASGADADALTEMVREVNATQVAENEVLSDHAYFYSRENKELACA